MLLSLPRWYSWFFWIGALSVGLISLRTLVLPLDVVMPAMAHYLADVPLGLQAHIIAAPLALILAPFQLWRSLRARRPVLHRWTGRAYGLAVLVAAIGSLVMVPHFTGSTFAALGFVALAVLWIGFTALGIAKARAGDLSAHRRWILRSVALTFAAVTLRLIMAPLMAMGWELNDTYLITAWGSWLINLAVLEVWQARRLQPA
ncbi:DUF2306 domain-containing protein [Pararhodobacter zhoushanensis]|uniref:DUF2306 domain-containing protein n=1 Tax=Pararhodobacter zhoushanensis TaxID=2479545 RepID=A0ABT3GZ26_9RHOB|nr:DUF2306 domain-containing protein [Pararhodobacter zhoushanensis]MCW1932804.1 DUF2306 domain-containing protein [Pararhodobacter zhoushanensis]